MSKVEHLYVHVPFCAAKCHYCAFYSEAGSAEKMGAYVDGVVAELSGCADQLQPRTIFFGGGTPSLLPAPLMRRVLEAVGGICSRSVSRGSAGGNAQTEAYASATGVTEWTIECNPATISTEKSKLFREFGVNRISMGVQALDDAMLEVLGRIHTEDSAVRSYEKLRAAGFENINLDLMFGLPGQTVAHWQETLRRAIALQPEHLSTYCLILEEDTEFWRLFKEGHIKPNEEQELVMYEMAIETLAAAGYRQYEISNFAKPGRECLHNIAYWEGKNYLGVGPSACSTVGERRWQNTPALEGWIVAAVETITPELRAAECAAFGMRMNAGVPAELVRGRWKKEIAELLSAELVQWRGDRLQPTRRGILFADEIAAEFV